MGKIIKALISYDYTTYGCQRNEEGEMLDWINSGSEEKLVEFEADENYSDTLNAIKALPQPSNHSNTYTQRSRFKVIVLSDLNE